MHRLRSLALILVIVTGVVGTLQSAEAAPKSPPGPPAKVKIHKRGQAFCPATALVAGGIVLRSGRCYTVYLLRDTRGTFLAFAPAGTLIPPGQVVRLNTPAGAKVRGRIFYMVPVRTVTAIPVNSLALVAVRVEDLGTRTTMVIVDHLASGITVVFNVRL